MRAYIDADVLIWHLRGEAKALKFLQALHKKQEYDLWIGAMQRAEVVFFMRPEEEYHTLMFLSQFNTAPLTQDIIYHGAELFRTWNKSHGIDINDALLAATAVKTGGTLFCLNTKHYPMPGILVQRAWR